MSEGTSEGTARPGREPRLRIDDARVKSSYCNVCNATSTRDEVVLNFGLNQTWDRGGPDLEVELHHRVIMSPQAVKRLHGLIGDLLEKHEERYGPLDRDGAA